MSSSIIASYRRLPCERKRLIAKIFSPVKPVWSLIKGLRFHIYQISGDGNPVFIAPSEPDILFLRSLYPGATLKKTRSVFVWSLRRIARTCDPVIIEIPGYLVPFFHDGIITPPLVQQGLEIDKPPEKFKQFQKRKKNILSYDIEVSHDPEMLAFFYEKMHVPYIQKRHRDGRIEDFSKLQYYAKKDGELLLLRKGDQPVGGIFCRVKGETYKLFILGLIDDSYLKEDAMGALYYYSMVRAREVKARFIDYGGSRPFLFDGLLEYKRMWGGNIGIDERNKHFFYLKNVTRDGLIFLENNKLMVEVSVETAKSINPGLYPGINIRIAEPGMTANMADYVYPGAAE